jgi:hypothetical protein
METGASAPSFSRRPRPEQTVRPPIPGGRAGILPCSQGETADGSRPAPPTHVLIAAPNPAVTGSRVAGAHLLHALARVMPLPELCSPRQCPDVLSLNAF